MHAFIRSSLSFVIVALAGASATAQDCSNSAPLPVGESLYKHHHDFIHSKSGGPPLTRSFRALVMANIQQNLEAGDVGAVDWDFWTDAQDGAASPDVRASIVRRHGARATVRLRYRFHLSPESAPKAKTADVHLVRAASGCWLVDDLQRNGKSLRAILRRGTRPSVEVQ